MKKRFLVILLVLMLVLTSCQDLPITDLIPTTGLDGGVINPDAHVDADNNGKCDDCGISVIVTFDFYAINDLHGRFEDSDDQPGVDELTTYLKNAYKTEDNVVLLSSGDMWQGTPESNLTYGNLMTEWMNELDFVSMTLGNHEYDWGEEYIQANERLAEFPFLAINVYDAETDQLADYVTPSVIVVRNGIKIGIIGAIGDVYSSIASERRDGVYFKTGSELTALVKAESEKLRAQGADFIVYSIHDGYESSSSGTKPVNGSALDYYDTSLSNGYVDLVFEGHSHCSYVLTDEYGVYHLQNGGENDGISHVEVNINFANSKSQVKKAEIVRSSVYDDYQDDPIVQSLLTKYGDLISKGKEVVGNNLKERDGETLRLLIAKLYYLVGDAYWGDEYDIVLGGGYLSVRNPYDLQAGEITYGDLYTLFPFDNQLVLCSMSGAYLNDVFFETPSANYFYYYESYGASVKGNVDPNATYYVIVDSYSSTYAPNHMTEIARFESNVYARDLLALFAKDGGFEQSDILGFVPNADPNPRPIEPIEISIPDLLSIGNGLEDNAESTDYFMVGDVTVKSVVSNTYGNMTVEDEYGNELYVYGVWSRDGNTRYDALDVPPIEGDTVTLVGTVKKYVANDGSVTIELYYARLYEHTVGAAQPDDPKPDDPDDPAKINYQIVDETVYVVRLQAVLKSKTDQTQIVVVQSLTELHRVGKSDTWSVVEYAGELYYVSSSALTTEDVSGKDFVPCEKTMYAAGMVMIKQYPSTESFSYTVGFLMAEDEVAVIAENGTWSKIMWTTDGVTCTGFVKSAQLTDIPVEPRPEDPTPDEPKPDEPKPDEPTEITIREAIKIGEKLEENTESETEYIIEAEILEVTQTFYGNMYLIDAEGNTLYVYGTWDETGTIRYGNLGVLPVAGDTVRLQGKLKKFINSGGETVIELMNGKIISHTALNPEEPPVVEVREITIPEALKIGQTLEDNALSVDSYIVRGWIVAITNTTYGNAVIEDEYGNQIVVYGLYNEDGTIRYDSLPYQVVAGDLVELKAPIKKYVNVNTGEVIIELISARIMSYEVGTDDPTPDEPKPDEPQPPVDEEPIRVSVFEAILIGQEMKHDTYTAETYKITAEIVEIVDETYGNLYVQDDEGNRFYIYGLYDPNGNRYDTWGRHPAVGDVITVKAPIGQYNGVPQMKHATVVAFYTPEPPIVEDAIEIGIADANKLGEVLEDNAESEQEYIVEAGILEITQDYYGNLYLVDEYGNTLYVYGVWDEAGSVRYGDLEVKPVAGDIVRLQGKLKKHVTAEGKVIVELFNAKILSFYQEIPEDPTPDKPKPDEPEDPTVTEPTMTSIPELIAIGKKLEANTESETAYFVTGTVLNIENDFYGNMNISDENGKTLYVYGTWDESGSIRYGNLEVQPKDGDTVVLCGWMKKYVTEKGEMIIEMINARILSVN